MDFPLPPMGEGLFEVELVRWLVRPGQAVTRGQALAEVMSDKATMELPAPFAGTISGLAAEPGTKVKVGQAVLSYEPDGGESHVPAHTEPAASSPAATPPPHHLGTPQSNGTNGHAGVTVAAPAAAPSVRLLARKLGVDLGGVKGTGPHGRILLDDLGPYLTRGSAPSPKAAAKPDELRLDFGTAGTKVKLTGLRRKIAEHMVASTRNIPHYSYIDECDFTDLVRLRAQLREPLAKTGVKLTYLAFLVKAIARALKEVPVVNATFDEATEEITLHDRYHIGVAVAAPNGLIVPVVKDADRKDVAAIAAEIDRLSTSVKAGRVRPDDLKGGTFTVTSVGNIGGLISTPIINHPQVGIMGVGKVVKRPVFDAAGAVRPADVVYLSFSFDHRIVDGAVGAAFGNVVVKNLQAPAALLLPEKFGG